MGFKELRKGKISEIEQEFIKEWEDKDILNQTILNRDENNLFVFYDGPATANGMPGIHHLLGKFLKDSICKYKTMKGYRVYRKVGWDTHGLPVELDVEKKLGLTSKKEIEDYGIEKFNHECRLSVMQNEKAFSNITKKMGQFIDLENPYVTYDNNYIETEWWILKKMFDEGYIYEGHKVLPYCPRCGTGLASHEVAQGYKDVSVNSVIVPMKMKDSDIYFLVWTTTPWTLLANVALAVNPNEEYVLALSKGYKFIVAKTLVNNILGDEIEILETYKGSDLEYKEYEQLMPYIKVDKKAFYVTCAEYVTMEDGTGIVHIAPAFGEDDYEVSVKYNLPVVNPVDEEGKYTEGPWKGRFVVDSELEIEILKYLKENDKLFKKIKLEHNYPHCWRCDTPLIYYSKGSWYFATTKIKDKIIENNKNIRWVPEHVGTKRFGNWLENLRDWAISRQRYWGTPLPLWTCKCGHKEMIGSVEELVNKSIDPINKDIDLHRPYVDEVYIKCPECGESMKRVPDVIDCWFDSGSMPFAQHHYPFENKDFFEKQFPADFISEGIDQTRGWFYVLLVISTFVTGKSPYKSVLVNDLLLDAKGKKMSKSRGNIVVPNDIINEFGADTMRYYFPSTSPVWLPTKFDKEGLKEIYSKYISTFKNTYSFFQMYANADKIDPRTYNVDIKNREYSDKWIIARLNKLIKEVDNAYESYDLTIVVNKINEFLNNDLSNWYIRINRRRFWESELTESKKAVYLTTYEVLKTISLLTAPITPFISEEIYQNLTGESSVHLGDFPTYDESLINEEVITKMDMVRDICSLGRFARDEAKIKVRQPIGEVILDKKIEPIIKDLTGVIKEELNVKDIVFITDRLEYTNLEIKPNYREVGSRFGSNINEFNKLLQTLSQEDILKLEKESITLEFMGKELVIEPNMVMIVIKVKEGYYSASEDNLYVILNAELTPTLLKEGLAREVVRTVQALRKELDLNITDNIEIDYNGTKELIDAIEEFEDYIKGETLATIIKLDKEIEITLTLNDESAGIIIKKI
jgi:isoleucyl-tRNA synthetase